MKMPPPNAYAEAISDELSVFAEKVLAMVNMDGTTGSRNNDALVNNALFGILRILRAGARATQLAGLMDPDEDSVNVDLGVAFEENSYRIDAATTEAWHEFRKQNRQRARGR